MTIRFSRAEYWLLDVAVESSVSIADLVNDDAAQELNRSSHQCTEQELADGLERLFADRFITSYRHGVIKIGRRCGRPRRRSLTRPEIEVELRRPKIPPIPDDPTDPLQIGGRHPDETYYELTPAGGAAWEDFARPNWDLFIEGVGTQIDDSPDYVEPPCPSRGYAICPTRRMIERYIAVAHHIGNEIDMASLRWDIVSPWKATYWKTLPTAIRARYKMIFRNAEDQGWPSLSSEVFDLPKWWYRWRS